MHPALNSVAALTLSVGGLLMTGCCGPLVVGGCHSGCSEVYVDPWISDPPELCDPCDSCGNYNGQTCGSCRPVFAGLKTIWGYRYDGGCGGCDSCGGLEPGCGIGIEPTCGFETGVGHCDGCASCSGGHTQYVESSVPFSDSGIPYGESVIESDPVESARVVVPQSRTRSVTRPAPHRALKEPRNHRR